ncbi:MAG: GNAT family N-acetyltransferase [Candidatus Zixiibacteriota bacterium]
MSRIKRIGAKDYARFVDIVVNAYPGMGVQDTEEEKKKIRDRLLKLEKGYTKVRSYGLYRNNELLGGMRLFDFDMTLFETCIPVGGVGLVAVDLNHKKERVCKELIEFFHQHYLDKEACMTALYPFRPDFYRKMGYGYGPKLSRYYIKPADLPRGKTREHIHFLTNKDFPAMEACYNRYAARTHGMMKRMKYELPGFEKRNLKMVGYKSGNKVLGYMVFSFKNLRSDNFILNDIIMEQIIYENGDALSEMMAFLHTQADQINAVVFNLLDDNFHFLPFDPRNNSQNLTASVYHESNIQAVGLMYRIIDMKKLFKILVKHNFNGQNIKLKIGIRDSFLPGNSGEYIVHITDGRPALKAKGPFDVGIEMDIAEFSSMLMGCVDFKSLLNYGLAEISDMKYLDTVNRLFLAEQKPICWTQF